MKEKTTDVSYISERLVDGGYKMTKQRYEIIKTIYKNNTHMNADEIYKKVKHKKIGLSTVYRNLMILEAVGVLKRINVANKSYYELQAVGDVCIHVKCIKCNKIIDIKKENLAQNLEKLIKNIKEDYGIKINDPSIVLLGICEKCENNIRIKKSKEEKDMPLILAAKGNELNIKKISGNDETKRFLNSLGFVVGEKVKIISEIGGNLIINIKDSRVALDKSMAIRIMV